MKNKALLILLYFVIYYGMSYGQNLKKAGIFQFSYQIDQKFTEETSVKNENKNFFTTFSSSEPLPDYFVDSIISITEKALSKKYNYDTHVIYFKNKKGKNLETIPVNGMVGGLPATSFKKIIKQHPDNDYYIKVMANLYPSGGVKFNFGTTKYSIIKPRLTLKVVVLDKNKKVVSKDVINLKDLTKVRSREKQIVEFDHKLQYKETEGLSSFDLFMIYKMGLEKLVSDKK